MTRRFEAAVFDLFGTLVPEFARTDFSDTVRTMADTLGVDPVRFRTGWERTALERQTGAFLTVEANVRAICASIGARPSDRTVARALEARLELYRKLFHPRPGALETLVAVKERGYGTALVSMCAPDAPAMWRASSLAPHIDVEVFSSETGLCKPHPAIYRLAAEGLGVEPEACLYVGDGAYRELNGAEAVGMTAYLLADPDVDPSGSLTPERDDWHGASVADLRELLDLLPDRRRAGRVKIADLLTDPRIVDAEAHLDRGRVERYAATLDELPPVVAFETPEGLLLVDGYHRVAAARAAGLLDVDAEIRPGSRRDALRYAAFRAAAERGISEDEAVRRIEAWSSGRWGPDG